jgi:hypothetical protein
MVSALYNMAMNVVQMNVAPKTDTSDLKLSSLQLSVQGTNDCTSTSQLEPEPSAHIVIRAYQNSHHVTASHIFPQNPSRKSHPFSEDQSVPAQPLKP